MNLHIFRWIMNSCQAIFWHMKPQQELSVYKEAHFQPPFHVWHVGSHSNRGENSTLTQRQSMVQGLEVSEKSWICSQIHRMMTPLTEYQRQRLLNQQKPKKNQGAVSVIRCFQLFFIWNLIHVTEMKMETNVIPVSSHLRPTKHSKYTWKAHTKEQAWIQRKIRVRQVKSIHVKYVRRVSRSFVCFERITLYIISGTILRTVMETGFFTILLECLEIKVVE